MRNGRRHLPVVLAAALLAFTAAPASAELLVDGGVVTEPGGIVRTPDGALWVSDGVSGVCKVAAGNAGYVFDAYCEDPDHLEVDDENLPEPAPTAPTGAADMEFDVLSSSFYVAEGTSKSSGVWRLHWNETTGAIDSAEKIYNSPGDARVFALTLARVPAGTPADPLATTLEVDFATKRSPIVRRLTGAESGIDLGATNIGTAIAEEPVAIARFGDDVFLAEATGVTRIDNPGGGDGTTAEPFAQLEDVLPGSLLADPVQNRLYVGTDGGTGADEIVTLDGATGQIESFEGGMSSITALAFDEDGSILAGDDPATASGAVDAFFGGRVFRFAPAPFGLPRVEFLSAPSPVSAADPVTGTFEAAFTFRSTVPGATLECQLDASATWEPCDGAFTTTAAAGTHELRVRASNATGVGRPTSRVFVIDGDAPEVSVDNPESDRVITRRSLNLRFTANEGGATFTCAVDGAAAVPCSSPHALRNLALGGHSVVVQATDMAGHVSAPVTWTFEVTDPPPPPPQQDSGNSGPGPSSGPGPGPAVLPRPDRRPVAFSADSRNDPCRPGVTATLDMRRPPAVIRVRFASGQRPGYVRIVVSRKAKRAGRRAVKVLTMHRVIESSKACARIGWGLWRSEARKLRTGRYTIEVYAGATRSSLTRTFRGGLSVIKKRAAR